MRNPAWMRQVSRRWLSARRGSGGAAPSVLASAGIAVGVAALVVVLGVMNGFQRGYMETILEISSFDLRVDPVGSTGDGDALHARLKGEAGVKSVVPFSETQVLAGGSDGRSQALKVRAIPRNTETEDPSFVRALGLPEGMLSGADGLVIGSEFARYLNVVVGDEIDILTMSTSREEGLSTASRRIPIGAIYHSGFYDFDMGLAFIARDRNYGIFPEAAPIPLSYGIKMDDRNRASLLVARLEEEDLGKVVGWRDYNKAFFGALRTEKTVMMILVGLIFVVVGVNIYQSMRRSVHGRMEEIALLRSLGAKAEEIRTIFIADGVAIGASGAFIGLVLGLLIATNVNEIIAGASAVMNWIASLFAGLPGRTPRTCPCSRPWISTSWRYR